MTAYSPGTILYLLSATLNTNDMVALEPTTFDQALRAGGARRMQPPFASLGSALNERSLVFRVQVVHAYSPFTMSVVCRVRLTAVFDSPSAAAPTIPLPEEHDSVQQHQTHTEFTGDGNESEPEYILKLYDRRCYQNVREEYRAGPYTEKSGRAYQSYLQREPAQLFTRYFWQMHGLMADKETGEHDLGLFEAWLENDAETTWLKELAAYDLLVELQGNAVPFCYDAVVTTTTYHFSTGPDGENGLNEAPKAFTDRQSVRGILLEYVDGISLRSFVDKIFRSRSLSKREVLRHITSIGDEAVALILHIGRYPLLNRDVRIDNMLVRQLWVDALEGCDSQLPSQKSQPTVSGSPIDKNDGEAALTHQSSTDSSPAELRTQFHRCVAIDFGQTRLRFPDETDEQWRCAKMDADEEGSLGGFYEAWVRKNVRELWDSETGMKAGEQEYDVKAIWRFNATDPWYRELSEEEQQALQREDGWGEHPDSWK